MDIRFNRRRIIIDKHIKFSKFDHRYREEKVVLLYNKQGRFYYPIIETAFTKSLMRLRHKLLESDISWNYHIVLTYSNNKRVVSHRGTVLPTQSFIDGDRIRRIYFWVRGKKIESYDKAEFPIIPDIEQLKEILQVFRTIDKDFLYAWKYEEGEINHRPHWHLLFRFSGLCTGCTYFLIDRLWRRGRVDVKRIITKMQLEVYVLKDFTKDNKIKFLHPFRRKWSTSRGVIPNNKNSKFELKTIGNYSNAVKLFESTKNQYLDYYKNDAFDIQAHYRKTLRNLRLGQMRYKSRLPDTNS